MSMDFRILQANLRKTRETQLSLLNDEGLQDFGLLLIQEPHCYRTEEGIITAPQHHAYWTPYTPTTHNPAGYWPFRSMIWAHRDLAVKQVPVPMSDVTALLTRTGERRILVFSIYVAKTQDAANDPLPRLVSAIRDTIAKVERLEAPHPVEIIIAGDFNRHDQLWGGDRVAYSPRQGEGEAILEMMADLNLQSLLPRGTITYESALGQSTIDLVLASEGLAEVVMQCDIYGQEHGSDHQAIQTSFSILRSERPPPSRLLLRHAPWSRIQETVKQGLRTIPQETHNLDQYTDHFLQVVREAVLIHTPRTRPSPYTKRWWTADLTRMRRDYTYWRNQARSHRRGGTRNEALEARALEMRREYHRSLREQKKQHWDTFLENGQNIWQAARYLQPDSASTFAAIPNLKVGATEIDTDEEIASTLMTTFFPPSREVLEAVSTISILHPLPSAPLIMDEVERAICAANPWKAPGIDDLPAVVWQKLWPVVKEVIFHIFNWSLIVGQQPRAFKIAKIIPLRKPNKADYVQPGAYRPISLLSTLGKALESIVAERISCLAETHHLLPQNHFGARKCRSTTQALTLLQERIYDAWREQKVLSLVSFDVKGAYNGVHHEVLLQRLRARRLPEMLVNWVASFCTDRRATIVVNGQGSATMELTHPGLPQGSPLSPILFLFFNANLVSNVLNKHQGAIAFVDDYSAWVTGPSAASNTEKIQQRIIPRAESWESSSGATFEPAKTIFIHFSRAAKKRTDEPLIIQNEEVRPQKSAKILGVVMDQELRFHEHWGQIAKRGIRAVMALKRLRALTPRTTRQLFQATVIPRIDYASFVWSSRATGKLRKLLEPIQRIASQAIVGVFRTVALCIAQAEANIEPLQQRWRGQAGRTWVQWHTLPPNHPFWKTRRRLDIGCRRYVSPLQQHARFCQHVDVSCIEKIHPYVMAPWAPQVHVHVEEDRTTAMADAQKAILDPQTETWWTDGSSRNNLVGIGVLHVGFSSHQTIGTQQHLNVYFAELFAIYQAVLTIRPYRIAQPEARNRRIHLYSDSQAALKAVAHPRQQSGQFILHRILGEIEEIRHHTGVEVELRWVPAHGGIVPNEVAHELSRLATQEHRVPLQTDLPRLLTIARREARVLSPGIEMTHRDREFFRRHIDQAMPRRDIGVLYDGLSKQDAGILSQLRTGKCRLHYYLARIGAAESELCECGREAETVPHYLFRCPRWDEIRRNLQVHTQPRWGDHAYCLGAWNHRRDLDGKLIDGERTHWKPDMKMVKKTLEFVRATQRFESSPLV